MTMVDGLWANTRDALISDFATVVWRMKLLGVRKWGGVFCCPRYLAFFSFVLFFLSLPSSSYFF